MELFGVGIGEAGLVLLITLLVVGPERFPQIAREGGKYYRMARRFTAEVTGDLRVALNELENEVNEQAGDLKAVREIGEEVRAGLSESATDIDAISRATAQAASTDTAPSAAAPDARRESESAVPPAAGADPFARVASVYSDYHSAPPVPSSPAETPEERAARVVGDPFGPSRDATSTSAASSAAASEAEGDELSRQAVEAFEQHRRTTSASGVSSPPSPQQIVGVNPFGSAEPPASPPETRAKASGDAEEPAAASPRAPGA